MSHLPIFFPNSLTHHFTSTIFLLKCSKKLSASIYSDSDSTDKEKTDNTASDSQNHTFRTKAALKEFNSHQNSAAGKASNRTNKDSSSLTTNQAKDKERLDAEKERLQDSYESDQPKPRNRSDKVQKERQEKTAKLKEKGREKQEKERVQREKAEKERLAKIEQERIEKEAAEKERIERLQHEKVEKSKDKKKRKDVSKDFPTDLLVVPQRQAAKKASENMMRTQAVGSVKKEQTRDDDKKELPKELSKIKDRRDSSKDSAITKETTIKQKSKTSKASAKSMTQSELITATSPVNEPVEKKDVKTKKADKVDKNIIVAYVPQRQAAKKAAEHIKGLGKVVAPDVAAPAVAAPPVTATNILTKTSSKHKFDKFTVFIPFKCLH